MGVQFQPGTGWVPTTDTIDDAAEAEFLNDWDSYLDRSHFGSERLDSADA